MKHKQKKRLAWIAVAAAIFIAGGYWTFGSGPSKKPSLETAGVEFGDLAVELPATGSIDAVNVIDVGAAVSGRIKALYADFNDHVKAGQLLAQIEDDDYRATYLQAKADEEAARAAIGSAEADLQSAREDHARAVAMAQRSQVMLEKARLDYERNQKLVEPGIVTRAAFEQLETAYRSAKADADSAAALVAEAASKVKGAQAAIDEARATAEQRAARTAMAKRNVEYCRITSPVDGVVVSRNADAGQTVAARLQAPSIFHIAQDLTHMYVYTKLDSSDVAKVHPGLRATFSVNAFPGRTFEGTLVQVRMNANAQPPVSRANPGAGFQRTLSSGVTAGSLPDSSSTATAGGQSGSSGGAGGSSTGQSGGSSGGGSASGASTASTSASAAPPTGSSNTVVVYDALIEFRNPDEKLLPGMTAYVTIPLSSIKGTLKVPAAALRFSPDISAEEKQELLTAAGLRDEDPHVWVVTAGKNEKKYRPVRVKPLLTDYVMTAIEAPDLKPGQQVATRIVPPRTTG